MLHPYDSAIRELQNAVDDVLSDWIAYRTITEQVFARVERAQEALVSRQSRAVNVTLANADPYAPSNCAECGDARTCEDCQDAFPL